MRDALGALDPASLTPLEALAILTGLRDRLKPGPGPQ